MTTVGTCAPEASRDFLVAFSAAALTAAFNNGPTAAAARFRSQASRRPPLLVRETGGGGGGREGGRGIHRAPRQHARSDASSTDRPLSLCCLLTSPCSATPRLQYAAAPPATPPLPRLLPCRCLSAQPMAARHASPHTLTLAAARAAPAPQTAPARPTPRPGPCWWGRWWGRAGRPGGGGGGDHNRCEARRVGNAYHRDARPPLCCALPLHAARQHKQPTRCMGLPVGVSKSASRTPLQCLRTLRLCSLPLRARTCASTKSEVKPKPNASSGGMAEAGHPSRRSVARPKAREQRASRLTKT